MAVNVNCVKLRGVSGIAMVETAPTRVIIWLGINTIIANITVLDMVVNIIGHLQLAVHV